MLHVLRVFVFRTSHLDEDGVALGRPGPTRMRALRLIEGAYGFYGKIASRRANQNNRARGCEGDKIPHY